MRRRAFVTCRVLVLIGLTVLLLGACTPAREEAPPAASPTREPAATPTREPTAPPSPEPATARWEPTECKFFGSGSWRCGYLVVPEDRTQPDSAMIRLYAVVIAAASDNREPDPLVFLSGGPGVPAMIAVGHIKAILGDILQERDLVAFDQRGVGLSEPALDCPEYEEVVLETYGADVSSEEARERMFDAMRACRDRLTEEGVNLSAYTSAASAADVHDLMEALGYDRYNLYGGSYGTRLALTIMRDFPDEVRSAVLDSVVPLHVNIFELRAVAAYRAMQRVFEQCAEDQACNEKYPDLEETFLSLLDELEEEPLPVSVRGTTYQVGADEFVELVLMGMYDTTGISGLPSAIYKVAEGQTSSLSSQVEMVLSMSQIVWEGMNFSVTCHDEALFNSAEEADAINANLHPAVVRGIAADSLLWLLELCEMWGMAEADEVENEPVRVGVSTLILTGEFDPDTPLDFATSTAEYLPKAQSFMIPGHTHDVLSSSACARAIMRQFLDAPEETPDSSCLDQSKLTFY